MEKVSDLALIYGTTKEDRTACHLMDAAGIKVEWIATGQGNTPHLIHGYRSYDGLREIEEFIFSRQGKQEPRR